MAEELRDIGPLEQLLSHRPLGILSDIDGTVAPIVPSPEDAQITDRARTAFDQLIGRGVRIAFITGRALERARQMVGIENAFFAANHGLNIYANGTVETPEAVREYVDHAQAVLEQIHDIPISGVLVEDKGPVVAFHYRKAESEAQAVAAIMTAIDSAPASRIFRIQEGRKVIELRPPLALDKGTAMHSLVGHMQAKAVICMGDDATDMDMFRGVARLKAEGMPGANMAVWSPEINPLVLESTDYFVRGVEGVEWLLEELVRAIPLPSTSAGP